MTNQEAFIKYKPAFDVEIRGNAVNDSEDFTSKSGNNFSKFKIAYSPAKDAPSVFLEVLSASDTNPDIVSKGDFVKVVGNYRESRNIDTNGKEWLNRTIFASTVEILGTKEVPTSTKKTTKTTKKGK